MDVAFIIVAFAFGFAAAALRLPPLVGYLVAGFLLHALGFETTEAIEVIADFGVLLLLFGIGLKLKLRTLARPAVWGGASVHLALMITVFGMLFVVLRALAVPLITELSIDQLVLIAFAFSFSSTVYAVKALEDRNESGSLQGRISVGILIVQDIFAVTYLTISVDTLPSPWALPVVVAVVAARPVYGWLLDRSGHGELLILLGFVLAIGVGAGTFDLVGLKADLGALIVGLTLANHRRAPEIAQTLLDFKDILLIGFFLSIGLGGAPGPAAVGVAVAALLLLPLKAAGFVFILTRFRLRARTSWHSSVTLATFSEFGLIVVAAAVEQGTLDQQWSSAVAVAVAASFALVAPLNTRRYAIYARWSKWLGKLERSPIDPDDALIEPDDANVMVFGMGRVGAGAYDEIVARRGSVALAVDRVPDVVSDHVAAGRRVIRGDALDSDFWDRVRLHAGIELVVLAMSSHQANLEAVSRVRTTLPAVRIAATATHPDEVAELETAGVDVARNLYGEAGQGLADDACDLLDLSESEWND
jgi:glutathione-regulated potassium-efflux system ancillary protein KefC